MKGILAGVGTFTGYDPTTNALIVTSKTLKTSNVSTEISSEEARGGQGNALLGKYYHDSALKLELTDQLWDLNYFAFNLGGAIEAGGNIIKSEQITIAKDGEITPTSTPVDFTDDSGLIGWYKYSTESDENYKLFNFVDGVGVVKSVKKGEVVCIKYPVAEGSRQYKISSSFIPKTIHAQIEIPIFKSGVTTGSVSGSNSKIGYILIDIPSFQFEGSQSLSLDSSGIADVSLSGSALMTYGSQASCDSEGYYATLVEKYYNSSEWDDVQYLAVADGSVEVKVGETAPITVYKIYSNGTMPAIVDPSKLTFAAKDTSIATIDASGVVKGVLAGNTTFDVTVTDSSVKLNTAGTITVVGA